MTHSNPPFSLARLARTVLTPTLLTPTLWHPHSGTHTFTRHRMPPPSARCTPAGHVRAWRRRGAHAPASQLRQAALCAAV
eukprot:363609-Chlamydomonas_euryale.AAC.13